MQSLYPTFESTCLYHMKLDTRMFRSSMRIHSTTLRSPHAGVYVDVGSDIPAEGMKLKSKLLDILLSVSNLDDINDRSISYTIFLVNRSHGKSVVYGIFKFILECYEYYEAIRKHERNKRMYWKRKDYIRHHGREPPSAVPMVIKMNSSGEITGSYPMTPSQFRYQQICLTKQFFKEVSAGVSPDVFEHEAIYKYMNDINFVYYDANTHEFITDAQIARLFRNRHDESGSSKIHVNK